jgi:hypothetical protein
MIEKALQLREGLRKNPEMLVDSLTLKQIFVWLMDNRMGHPASASSCSRDAAEEIPAAAPGQLNPVEGA